MRDRQQRALWPRSATRSCFVLGFSAVFVAFGASATALGGLLLSWRYELGIVAGVVVLLFGLHMAGLLPIHLLEREARFHAEVKGGRVVGAFLLGLAFAFGWTPCIGPVLGVILTMSASTADLATGTALLAVYSLGLGLPFLLAALFTDVLLERLRQLSRTGRQLQRVVGRAARDRGRADDHRPARGHGLLAARDLPGSGPHRLIGARSA